MRLHRFYVLQPLGEEVVINDVSLIKQWANVFRYKKGDFVILFNGDGTDVSYSIENISTKESVLSRKKIEPVYIPERKITIYISIIKKDLFELAVQKATEIGVSTIIPILSERSLAKNISEGRLNKIIIEASEQCGRGDVPTILPAISLEDVLSVPSPHEVSYYLNKDGKHWQNKHTNIKNIGLFIGPEGGWTENEENLFKKNKISSISLGETVLRAETASIVACALFI